VPLTPPIVHEVVEVGARQAFIATKIFLSPAASPNDCDANECVVVDVALYVLAVKVIVAGVIMPPAPNPDAFVTVNIIVSPSI
jgi:hypothetical protein